MIFYVKLLVLENTIGTEKYKKILFHSFKLVSIFASGRLSSLVFSYLNVDTSNRNFSLMVRSDRIADAGWPSFFSSFESVLIKVVADAVSTVNSNALAVRLLRDPCINNGHQFQFKFLIATTFSFYYKSSMRLKPIYNIIY